MVERIAPIGAQRLAMSRAGIEHQKCAWRRMRGKYAKHRPLVFVPEMKEAIPGQYPAKSPAKGQRRHIADDPFLLRHSGSA